MTKIIAAIVFIAGVLICTTAILDSNLKIEELKRLDKTTIYLNKNHK